MLATLIYLRDDFRRIVFALVRGMFRSGWRADPDWRFGWAVVLGSIPIGIVGLAVPGRRSRPRCAASGSSPRR